jgi:pectin methylesterase-like acyl-CoA thioesterase
LHFRSGVVQPDRRYFVTVEAGVFRDAAGAPLATVSDESWSFSTGRAAVSQQLVVDAAGSGDFCSVQGALDAVPRGNTAPIEIDVRSGVYHEILYVSGKSNVTLRGAGRDATRIEYPNNERLNPGTASRAMVTALNVNGLVLEQLTLHNSTPQGGGQAETIRVSGDRVILRDASFLSLQDTLLLDGLVYVADAYIEGNVDFVWGYGTAYFERSELKIVGRSGVIVQARNGADAAGYVFVDSRLTSDPNITGSTLARIDATEYPDSQVAFVDCQMGPHISPQGWTVTPTGTTATAGLRFWEYRSTDLAGQPLNVSRRDPASRQLNANEAATLRDRPGVLGGWDPTL